MRVRIKSEEDEDREEARLAKEAMDHAKDGCGICGREELWNGETFTIGMFRGKLRCAGECCEDRIYTRISVGYAYGGPDRPWNKDDSLWFKNNPTRSYRLRHSFAGERTNILHINDAKKKKVNQKISLESDWILVHQEKPGVRYRVSLRVDKSHYEALELILKCPDEAQEAVAKRLHDMFSDGGGMIKPTDDEVSLIELLDIAINYLQDDQ